MKKCAHCGVKLSDKAVVCVKCGYIQSAAANRTVPAIAAPSRSEYDEFPEIVVAPKAAQAVSPVPRVTHPVSHAPAGRLKTNRGMLKFILLSAITFGIYGIVAMSSVSTDINLIASRYDGRKTMHYCWVFFVFSWLTFGIVPLVWSHNISARIGAELSRRGIGYRFGAGSFWGWNVLGSFIFIGPFVYIHKLMKAMNLLSANYNVNG